MKARPGWTVLNRGVNGERSDQIRARFDRDVLAASRTASSSSPASTTSTRDARRHRHRAAARRCTTEPRKPAFASSPAHRSYNTATADQNARMREINTWINDVAAREHGVRFVDTRAAVAAIDNADRLADSPDGLHPSPSGYRRMAEAILPALEKSSSQDSCEVHMSRRSFALTLLLLVAVTALAAQQPSPPPRDSGSVVNQSTDPLLRELRYRSIGPASMGGRVDDIEAVESDPFTVYVGFATGGLWKTTNNGTTWTPLFDEQAVSSIGDVAIAPSNPSVIYVGTGELNNRQSSTIGNGMYKSIDAGKTWMHVGLADTQSIGRVVVDPKDPNTVYVAAVGHLFGPNKERGLFKTVDGGATWANTKFIDEDTGFIDVAMDPSDSRVLYASSYQRRRVPWGFSGGGPGSGLWKTTDAGKTWTEVTGSGFPGRDAGTDRRCGLTIEAERRVRAGRSRSKSGNRRWCRHAGGKAGDAQPGQGGGGGGGAGQQQQQQDRPPDPKQSGVWRSDDRGKTWRIMSNNNNRPMYYSQIRIDPTNDQIIYTMGASFYKSVDGGKTFRVVTGMGHGDHHALWINPRNSRHLLLGHDGGFDISYDQAETFDYHNIMAVGQFYAISADMRKPYCHVRRTAGQRELGRTQRHARSGKHERRLVPRWRRRRLLHDE